MKDHNGSRHRRSIRLKGYDYSQIGIYFITICTQQRKCMFGNIDHEGIILNDAGRMVEKWYFELSKKFHDVQCIDHVVMPNHIHFIIQNVGAGRKCRLDDDVGTGAGRTRRFAPTGVLKYNESGKHVGADLCVCPKQGEQIGSPLRHIIQWFKTMSTNEYMRNVKTNHWPPFDGKLWQRNYYEHVVRNEESLNKICEYIANNPLNWELDENYVAW